jgi:hypothetical protein
MVLMFSVSQNIRKVYEDEHLPTDTNRVIGTRQNLKKSAPLHLTVSGKYIENVKNQKVLGYT